MLITTIMIRSVSFSRVLVFAVFRSRDVEAGLLPPPVPGLSDVPNRLVPPVPPAHHVPPPGPRPRLCLSVTERSLKQGGQNYNRHPQQVHF